MSKYKVWSIEDAREVLDEISEKMGMDCSHIPIELSGRMRTCMGKCHFKWITVNGERTLLCRNITLAKALLNGDYSEENVRTVIIHEYVHFYTNLTENQVCRHDYRFKYNCRKAGIVDDTYLNFELNRERWKYQVTCDDCGNKFYKNRVVGGLNNYAENYQCGRCKGSLSIVQNY